MRAALAPALLACALGATLPESAGAQNSYQQVVLNQLTRMGTSLRERGYSPVSQPITGTLNSGADQGQMVALNAGMNYVVRGACDQDCTDVDLRIFAPNGQKLAEDVETDDYPLLQFTAPATGQYRLVVIMANCRQNPCFWGAQVFGK